MICFIPFQLNNLYSVLLGEPRGGASTFFHDSLKNTGVQTDSSAGVSATRHYDAWGNVVSSTGVWQSPFGYAGRFGYQGDPTGFKLLGHRYYDPTIGRFLTRDPIKDGRNWYAYCENAPLLYADPWGLARIYVAWRPVARGIGNHVYLIIVDEDTGQTWTIGGGPEPFSLGNLQPQLRDYSGAAGDQNYEGLGEGELPKDRVLIRDDDLPGQFWFDKLNNIGGEIDKADIPYHPLTTNSNAFIWTVMARAGLLDEFFKSRGPRLLSPNAWAAAPGGAEWAPGLGRQLPRY